MEETVKYYISEDEKEKLIKKLTPELSLLRVKAEISQEEIANIIGTSRQTYGAIERKARKMSWNTYLSLIMFYDNNKKTHKMIRNTSAFPHELIKRFNEGSGPLDLELEQLLHADGNDILMSLDEQALSTIKTVLMVEYSRCNNISGNAVVKLFEGINLNKSITNQERKVTKALKNLKKDI